LFKAVHIAVKNLHRRQGDKSGRGNISSPRDFISKACETKSPRVSLPFMLKFSPRRKCPPEENVSKKGRETKFPPPSRRQ